MLHSRATTIVVWYVLLLLLLVPPPCKSYFSRTTLLKAGTTIGLRKLYDATFTVDHSIAYWYVHTDAEGISTQKRQQIALKELPFLASAAAMLVSDSISLHSSKVKFLKLLPGALLSIDALQCSRMILMSCYCR